jgi:hypothetical protein
MEHKTLFVIDAVVLLLFGLGFLFMPAPLISMYGAVLQPPGVAMGRFFGATMLSLAWIMYRAQDAPPSKLVDSLMQANILVWILSAGIAFLGQVQKTFNLMGWSTILLGLFFGGWFIYEKYIRK